VPDIILNPHALPKRMTMATLIEIMTSKYAAMAGERVNGTVFRPFDLDGFMEILSTLYGYNMHGNEIMRSPITGETFPSQIMIGPAYYQLLKHQVGVKAHVRGGEGPRSIITGQAAKGKKRGGGTRFGESEAAGTIAHGAAAFLKERMFTAADPYTGLFCRSCNKMSVVDVVNERASCASCRGTDIGSCSIPRTFNTYTNYISSLGIRTDLFRSERGEVPDNILERRRPPSPIRQYTNTDTSSVEASSSYIAAVEQSEQGGLFEEPGSFNIVTENYDPAEDKGFVSEDDYDPRLFEQSDIGELFEEPRSTEGYDGEYQVYDEYYVSQDDEGDLYLEEGGDDY